MSSRIASAPWVERLLQFFQRAHFHLDRLRAAPVAHSALQRRHNSSGQRDVVVLDQHSVGKIEAVILSAAAAHRVLVDHAQAGSGLAGVENARLRAGDRIHKLARQGGDSAHALQKIQDHALARKNHSRIVPDHRDRLALVQPHAIENFGMRGHFVVRSHRAVERRIDIENARHAADARQNAFLLGENRRRRPLVGIDAGIAGRIARRPVFEQRVLDNRGDASADSKSIKQWPVCQCSLSCVSR